MFARKEKNTQGVNIPDEFKLQFETTLEQTFGMKKESEGQIFEVFGKIFEDELLLMVCLSDFEQRHLIPVSLFLSFELDEKSKKGPNIILDEMVDLTGNFFDEYFATTEFNDWEPNWQVTEYNKKKYFFKVTRENVSLSLQADALLEQEEKKQ